MPVAEILSQGDEVVTGQTIDTNAAWLAERLIDLGFELRGHTSVGDRLEHIQDAVTLACGRSDLVLSSGGLGPTDDDLTAAAVAAAAGVPLDFDAEAMRQIERIFQRFGKVMADSNRKQWRNVAAAATCWRCCIALPPTSWVGSPARMSRYVPRRRCPAAPGVNRCRRWPLARANRAGPTWGWRWTCAPTRTRRRRGRGRSRWTAAIGGGSAASGWPAVET